MRTFNPARVAYYETENWVAYYQKRWLRLLGVSVGMVRASYGLNPLQAAYGAYLVMRAEVAAAPFPNNDIPLAERYMRRFYAFIKRVHHEHFDVDETAHLEVRWWVIHRQLFGRPRTSRWWKPWLTCTPPPTASRASACARPPTTAPRPCSTPTAG
jgi:hypothetical protein